MIDKHGKKYLVIRFVENYDMEEHLSLIHI